MILQALVEYYNRKRNEAESSAPPYGWERKEISFVIVLDGGGRFLRIDDMRELKGKEKRGKQLLVPQAVVRTGNIKANLLWDSVEYIFGIGKNGNEKKAAFLKRMKDDLGGIPAVEKVINYVEKATVNDFLSLPDGEEILKEKRSNNVSFRTDGDLMLICNRDEVGEAIDSFSTVGEESRGICMVTGENSVIPDLHHPIKGVKGKGAQSSGGRIVSFNMDAFESYGRKGGLNAPVGIRAEFAYTTALNMLLKDTLHHMTLGDVTLIFWSAKKTSFETDFSSFFEEPPKDNLAMGVQKITALLRSPETGTYADYNGDTQFYLLGLSPNSARIAVRLWRTGTVSEFANNIRQYFEDFDITRPEREPEYYSIWRILVNSSVQNKSENIMPGLAGNLMESAITGNLYPVSLLQAVLRRIKSDVEHGVEHGVTPVRAAAVKAYLNRYYRLYPDGRFKEVTKMMDVSQTSEGYQLGRLFAVLEKIQEEASPGLNSTIRERYYSAASTTPLAVFPTLLRLKNHHLAKLENEGRKIRFEQMLGEIVDKLNDFPPHLTIYEQGMFAVGYYHQRQHLFTKRKDEPNSSAIDNKGVEKNE